MQFKILKKDLKRKKSINITIMIFVIMTTMFVASSINNLRVSMNGVEEFMDISHLADFTLVVSCDELGSEEEQKKEVKDFLDDNEYVKDYYLDESFILSSVNLLFADKDKYLKFENTAFAQVNTGNQVFFDGNNKEIKSVESGTVYVPEILLTNNDLKIGDKIRLKYGDDEKIELKIAGILKDALMGSSMMGNKRMLISDEDFAKLTESKSIMSVLIYGINTDNIRKFKDALGKSNLPTTFGADKALIKITYVMDTVIALTLLLVGLVLVAISGTMLKYTITFTVNEDFKEIGIMKAIGLKSSSIRRLYTVKYLIISVIGALIGFILSIPFSKVLLKAITKAIVIDNKKMGIMVELVTAVAVAIIVSLLAYRGTKPIKKLTPMAAIRGGNNGERFKRKNVVSLKKTRLKATSFMALSDVIAEWKKYIILVITSILGIWLIVMPINTINTLSSDGIVDWFAMVRSDIVLNDDGMIMDLFYNPSEETFNEKINEIENKLTDAGVEVDRVYIEAIFQFTAKKGDSVYSTLAYKGINTTTDEYVYMEGKAPFYENEVAITHVVAREIDAKIGDTILVNDGKEDKPYVVTAIFETMNNQGQGLRFADSTKVEFKGVQGAFGFQVDLKGNPSKKEIKATIEKIKEIYPDTKVMTMKEFVSYNTGGIIDQLKPVKYIVIAVVTIIILLVVTLMQKMFVIREQGEMGMLKAIGFTNKSIIVWQAKRAFVAIIIGIVIGTLTGTFFSQITSGLVFKLMGASKIRFEINIWEVYIGYPLLMVLLTIIGCVITMKKVKHINVFSMNEMD